MHTVRHQSRKRRALDHALFYLDHGISLLPLLPGSKEPHHQLLPVVNGKPSWAAYRARPASRAEVRGWFAEDPEVNLGMVCGTASGGLVVVDYDRGYHPGLLTPTSRTRRGYHSFYRAGQVDCRKFDCGELKGKAAWWCCLPAAMLLASMNGSLA